MGRLSTHVLDIARGCPAAGVEIFLRRVGSDDARSVVTRSVTNADGRTDAPLLSGDALEAATYELTFHVGDYFRRQGGADDGTPPFLDRVPIRFTVGDRNAHYHVPLLVSPWSYSTYRGS